MNPKEKPIVSVIIPTHNRARLLQEALGSVHSQEGVGEEFDMEVIVVDGASSDATPEVIRRYPGVRYLRLEPDPGQSACLNAGIRLATGKYVAFLDDDDLWLPYKLSLLVPVLEAHPEVGVAYAQVIARRGKDVSLLPNEYGPSGSVFRALLTGDSVGGHQHVVVRREVFEKAGYFDEGLSIHLDLDWMLRVAFYFPFKFVPGPIGIYRLSTQGIYATGIARGRSEQELRPIVEKALAMLPDTAEDYSQLRQQALLRVELKAVHELQWIGELDRMRAHLLNALREFPQIVRDPSLRSSIASKVHRLALASESPLDAVRAFCAEASAGRVGLRDRLGLRQFWSDVWSKVAIALGSRSPNSDRAAARAAAYAILYNPAKLRRNLLTIIAKAVLGPRTDTARVILRALRKLRARALLSTTEPPRGHK